MKQYCRYCAHAYLQGDDQIWCEPKNEIRSGSLITCLNRCPHFEFNPIDVLNPDHEYQPRESKAPAQPAEDSLGETQLSLF